MSSEPFTYTVADAGGQVLVLANEDYEGFNPDGPDRLTAPRYAQQYVDALTAAGFTSAVWDVSAQGVPHHLGVLSHFDSVVWYLGDNRLTQDDEDVVTETFALGPLEDAAVAERQQYLTLAVRDYLNEGGKLALTGETTAYYGQLGTALGGIYYGLDGAPDQDCEVTADPFSDCLLLADDFTQYYLGAFSRAPRAAPEFLQGVRRADHRPPHAAGGHGNQPDRRGRDVPADQRRPAPGRVPAVHQRGVGRLPGRPAGEPRDLRGRLVRRGRHADNSYMRLARTVDLTGVTAAQAPTLEFALSYDIGGRVRQRHRRGPPGRHRRVDDAAGGRRAQRHHSPDRVRGRVPAGAAPVPGALPDRWATPARRPAHRRLERDHRHLRRLAAGRVRPVRLRGRAGRGRDQLRHRPLHRRGRGVRRPDPRGRSTARSRAEGFETDLGPWSAPGAPEGSPGNAGDFERAQSQVGAAITTDDTVLLGFGIEQVPGGPSHVALAIVEQPARRSLAVGAAGLHLVGVPGGAQPLHEPSPSAVAGSASPPGRAAGRRPGRAPGRPRRA